MKSNEDYILTDENMRRFCSILEDEVKDKESLFYDEEVLTTNYSIDRGMFTIYFILGNTDYEEIQITMSYNKSWEQTTTWSLNKDLQDEWDRFVKSKLQNLIRELKLERLMQ